jgi:hypothetical protein
VVFERPLTGSKRSSMRRLSNGGVRWLAHVVAQSQRLTTTHRVAVCSDLRA